MAGGGGNRFLLCHLVLPKKIKHLKDQLNPYKTFLLFNPTVESKMVLKTAKTLLLYGDFSVPRHIFPNLVGYKEGAN